ncbi:MAG TPA: ethanolamine ammonia-lyase subunit EutC [Candidatus Acidoferrales bacterium]
MPSATDELPELIREVRARTPARILLGRAGAAYRTGTQLDLREAHAAARDAVRAELQMAEVFGKTFTEKWKLFEVSTEAKSKYEYLLRPDLGRRFDSTSSDEIRRRCQPQPDLQIAIGDGLSVAAVAVQVPALLPLICSGAEEREWTVGGIPVIRHCRVGILNAIGEILAPRVAVLLIGERPGLATAESLSAYMAYRPNAGHSDADRNLISNIHVRGLETQAAAARIVNLAAQMIAANRSGFTLREEPRALEIR